MRSADDGFYLLFGVLSILFTKIWQSIIAKYAFHNGIFITTEQKLRGNLGNRAP